MYDSCIGIEEGTKKLDYAKETCLMGKLQYYNDR